MSTTTTSNGNGTQAAPTPSIANLRGNQQVQTMQRRAGQQPPIGSEGQLPLIGIGVGNMQQFAYTTRVARMFSSSSLVPEAYRSHVKKKGSRTGERVENPAGLANCVIALNMAARSGEDAIAVMQNLHIIEGRPSWSSPYIISKINGLGRFEPIDWEITDLGPAEASYEFFEYRDLAGGRSERVPKTVHVKLEHNWSYTAVAKNKQTGRVQRSPAVTLEMAVQEGWYTKNGSKWRTMPDLMGRYRSAAFFVRTNCPEVLMGLRTEFENQDIIEAEQTADGVWEASALPDDAEAQGTSTYDPETGEVVETGNGGGDTQDVVGQEAATTDAAGEAAKPEATTQAEGTGAAQGRAEEPEHHQRGPRQSKAAQETAEPGAGQQQEQQTESGDVPTTAQEPTPPTDERDGGAQQKQEQPAASTRTEPPAQQQAQPATPVERARDWANKQLAAVEGLSRGQALARMQTPAFKNSIISIEALGPDGKEIAKRVQDAFNVKVHGTGGGGTTA